MDDDDGPMLDGEVLERALDAAAGLEDAYKVVMLWVRYLKTPVEKVAHLTRLERAVVRLQAAAAPFRRHLDDDAERAVRLATHMLNDKRKEILTQHPDFDSWPSRRREPLLRAAARRIARESASASVFLIRRSAWAKALDDWRGLQPPPGSNRGHSPVSVVHTLLKPGASWRAKHPLWNGASRSTVARYVRKLVLAETAGREPVGWGRSNRRR